MLSLGFGINDSGITASICVVCRTLEDIQMAHSPGLGAFYKMVAGTFSETYRQQVRIYSIGGAMRIALCLSAFSLNVNVLNWRNSPRSARTGCRRRRNVFLC